MTGTKKNVQISEENGVLIMTNFLNTLKKFKWKLTKAQGGGGQNHFQGGGRNAPLNHPTKNMSIYLDIIQQSLYLKLVFINLNGWIVKLLLRCSWVCIN